MQLVAYGAQDIYLTGNPQITFFKVVYRRHTNFSMETISQSLDGNATIGSSNNEASCTIARNGDLIHKMYVASSSEGIHHGSKIVKSAELEIGGQRIDFHTEEWNSVWNELTTPDSKAPGLKAMQCDSSGLSGRDIAVGFVQVPLNFYFCRNPGLALPLIALQYHEVKINFVFGTISELASNPTTDIVIKFFVDYIYLDTDERRRFAQVSHEYLIEQVQMQTISSDVVQELTFNHPVKELIWVTDVDYDYNTAILKLNGHDRFEKQKKEYFQLRQPFDYHTTVPKLNQPITNQIGGAIIGENLLDDPTPVKLEKADESGQFSHDPDGLAIITTNGTDDFNGNETLIASTEPQNILFVFHKTDLEFSKIQNIAQHEVLIIGSGDAFGGTGNKTALETIVLDVAEGGTNGEVIAGPSVSTFSQYNFITFENRIFNTEIVDTAVSDKIRPGVFQITGIHVINGGSQVGESYTSKFNKKINVYSFALRPEEHQPSGTCNFSRIDTSILEFGASPTGTNGNIYAVNYNVLRIMSGMGGLAYSN